MWAVFVIGMIKGQRLPEKEAGMGPSLKKIFLQFCRKEFSSRKDHFGNEITLYRTLPFSLLHTLPFPLFFSYSILSILSILSLSLSLSLYLSFFLRLSPMKTFIDTTTLTFPKEKMRQTRDKVRCVNISWFIAKPSFTRENFFCPRQKLLLFGCER